MSDHITNPFPFTNLDAMTGSAGSSLQALSDAYVDWLKNANRLQAEAIRFVGDRFNKDVQMIARFAACKQPEEFLSLQSAAANELVKDYLAEGARWITLLGDRAQSETKASGDTTLK